MEKLGADVIRVKGNYEKSLKVCKEDIKKERMENYSRCCLAEL